MRQKGAQTKKKENYQEKPFANARFNQSTTPRERDALNANAKKGIPHLVILNPSGKVVTDSGVEIIVEHGVEGYTFTQERLNEIKEQEETAKREQSLKSILESQSRNYVVAADGRKVLVTELEGKMVGLYFSMTSFDECESFTRKLIEMYDKLIAQGEIFKVVMIPLDDEDEDDSFKKGFASMPWFSLPLKDKTSIEEHGILVYPFTPERFSELEQIEKAKREAQTLESILVTGDHDLVIGKYGEKMGRLFIHSNVVEAIEEHGILVYPFTPERFSELEQIEKAKREAQTLESILVTGDHDFVIGKDGEKILVSDLVGKNILLYFSAHWCPPCHTFTKLKEAYETIKAKNGPLGVIFISSDHDQDLFDDYFATMSWMDFPFGDERKASLSRLFKVQAILTLVSIWPSGKTITIGARNLMLSHGAKAFPFTEERMKEIEAEISLEEKKEK
ncbi:hypothetical protein RND71_003339 [Anisodus tanguticus]|uniref:protein-disulfide reductase n=1 Tax=Anisodus tanguticus TaxID=243964 RepID=A0AAE1SWL3_9SOLA|nr:hypothetical protein RND71_003339 [Anisodus tanguticus]